MHEELSSATKLRDAAARAIAATAYFKSAGHLPDWARAEMQSRTHDDAAASGRIPPLAGS